MKADKKSLKEKENVQEGRIHLNKYGPAEETNSLKDHSGNSIKNVDRNLNEQMGGTDDTVTSEPNQI